MVFCPIARGSCPGRKKCRLWTRGRIIATDTKLLARRLASFVLTKTSLSNKIPGNSSKIPTELANAFWKKEGIPNIKQVCIIDRYLTAKVSEVEALATKWLSSPGFHAKIKMELELAIKTRGAPQKPPHKCPP